MAKFTSPIPLDLMYEGHILRGSAGTEFRIPDSLRAAFDAEFGTRVRPVWTVSDEIGEGGIEHPNLAAHISIGLISAASTTAHVAEADPHTQYATATDLLNHEDDTTAVHGIANAANLVLTNDSRLTDARTPVAHSHVDGDLPAGLARDSEVTSAIDTHAATPHGGSLPAGLIVMWGGVVSAIPSGWLLCDGTNGTPDLRSKFIKGAAAGSDPGATGGAATHTHAGHSDHAALSHSAHTGATVANHTDVLNHTHPENRNSATTGGLDGWAAGDTSTNTPIQTGYVTGNPSANGVAAQVHTVGQASAHSDHAAQSHSGHDSPNSEPPYYALCFLQKS